MSNDSERQNMFVSDIDISEGRVPNIPFGKYHIYHRGIKVVSRYQQMAHINLLCKCLDYMLDGNQPFLWSVPPSESITTIAPHSRKTRFKEIVYEGKSTTIMLRGDYMSLHDYSFDSGVVAWLDANDLNDCILNIDNWHNGIFVQDIGTYETLYEIGPDASDEYQAKTL